MPRLPAALLALTFAAPAFGQGIQKVSQTNQPSQQPAVPTLKATARLVYVDVVVHDKNGQPVHGLKAEDFALLESGKTQRFQEFQEHTAPTAEQIARMPMPVLPKLPEGIFSNVGAASTPQANGPLNILLLDRLNTPVENQSQMHTQINEFLATARRGQRMAIFGLTDHLLLLQGFTDDPEVLRAAVSKKGSFYSSSLRDDKIGGEGNSEKLKPSDQLADVMTTQYGGAMPAEVEEAIRSMKMFETLNTSGQMQIRIQDTLDALNALGRYLSALPGRKNLIWFSGSFPIDILPDINKSGASNSPTEQASLENSPFLGVASMSKEFRETTALLSRSQVAVYPIDAKGLTTISSMSAANVATSTGLSGRQRGNPVATTLEKDLNTEGEQKTDEHATMYTMAGDTGGKAAVNTNDLRQAVEDAIADGSNYYTIAYTPTDSNWNGNFRHIEVKLKQGYSLSYRKGYFADDPDALGSAKSDLASVGASASHAMLLALTHGGPTPTQLMFTARVLPVSATTEETLAPGNKAGRGDKAPYRRYRVDFAIDPRAIHFNLTPDGNRHAVLEFVTHVYDAEGNLVDSIGSSINANVIPDAYAQFQQSGVPYREEVSVPVKGEYYLRIAMRDVGADQVGAVEIPVSAVRDLPPAEVAVAAPASAPK